MFHVRQITVRKRAANRITGAFAATVLAAAASAASGQQIGDVFYIEMENHNFSQPASQTSPGQISGNSAAPYINSLVTPGNANAAQVSWAPNYYNVLYNTGASIHPSEPNYIWQEAGSNFGVNNDADPYKNATGPNVFSSPNLSGLLQAKGISWKSYQEDINLTPTSGTVNNPGTNSLTSTVAPQNQWTVPLLRFSGTSAGYTNPYNGSNQYDFQPKHDGQLFFTSTNGGTTTTGDYSTSNPEVPHYLPLQQLASDLTTGNVGKYNLITPDQFNDMHSALNTSFTYKGVTYAAGSDQEQIALGDNFLSKIIPQIQASQAYKNNGAIVIWNDETEGGDDNLHTSMEIVLSPLAKGNAYASPLTYTHSSDLKTLQELYGVGPLLNDAATPGTNDLSDLFTAGAVPEPGSLAVLTLGAAGLLARRRRA